MALFIPALFRLSLFVELVLIAWTSDRVDSSFSQGVKVTARFQQVRILQNSLRLIPSVHPIFTISHFRTGLFVFLPLGGYLIIGELSLPDGSPVSTVLDLVQGEIRDACPFKHLLHVPIYE